MWSSHGQDQEAFTACGEGRSIRGHPFCHHCHGYEPWEGQHLYHLFWGQILTDTSFQVSLLRIKLFSFEFLTISIGLLCIDFVIANELVSRYFMIANAIVSVYGFLVIFLPAQSLLWRLVIALDVVRCTCHISLQNPLYYFHVMSYLCMVNA